MSFWVYILRCADNSYYTGHTDNLEQRIAQHHQGYFPSCYTYKRRPLELLFSQDFVTREEALTSEQQIKGWSRKKKEAMMRGDWTEVSRLAKSPIPVRPETLLSVSGEPVRSPVSGEPVRSPVRGEPVLSPVRGEPVLSPVRGEPVEPHYPSTLRQAQGERETDEGAA